MNQGQRIGMGCTSCAIILARPSVHRATYGHPRVQMQHIDAGGRYMEADLDSVED